LRDVVRNRDDQASAVPARHRISVRGARAYLAGIGTSGSLLAGAAVLFLIGSAIVAFNGWPQIGVGPVTSNVSAAPLAASTRASRKLTLILAAIHRPAATHGRALTRAPAAARTRPVAAHRRTAVQGVVTGSVQSGSTGSAQPTSASGAATGGPPATAASQCGSCGGQKPAQNPTRTVTKTVSGVGSDVSRTVSNVGSAAGQTITNVTSAVGQQVGVVDQQAGNAVTSVGSTIGSTVSSTVTTAANAMNGLTGALGLGGH
jgi:hypothetical protein